MRCIVYLGRLFTEDTDSEHPLSRREVGIALRQGAVPVIELRIGIIVGPGSAEIEILRNLILEPPADGHVAVGASEVFADRAR